MKPVKIKCASPNCDNTFYEGEQCDFCGQKYCIQCYADTFRHCENPTCLVLGCPECIKQDKDSGLCFCGTSCKEDFDDNN